MDVIAVVTGASRGAGKGIAIALGETGATVYVTGRRTADGDSPYGGTVTETADLITRAGGKGIAIALDHTDDEAVAALFARVKAEHGRLDILVNNAANAVESTTMPGGFWEKPLEAVDLITVGLRSHFVSAYYAASLLIANGRGLIVHTGHYGAVAYYHGPAPMVRRRLARTRWLPILRRSCDHTTSRQFQSGWAASIPNVRAPILPACPMNRGQRGNGNRRNSLER
jgi:NAD(P)-dependent dehydrogenase (short-subunit alcohol dehydrogenase family)